MNVSYPNSTGFLDKSAMNRCDSLVQSTGAIHKCKNRQYSQVQSTGMTHKCNQQVQLTSVIKNVIELQVRSL